MNSIIEVMLTLTPTEGEPECPDCGSDLIDVSGGELFANESLVYDCCCYNCGHEWRQQNTLADLPPDLPYMPDVPCVD